MFVQTPLSGPAFTFGNGETVMNKIKLDDKVMFDQYSGVEVDIDGITYKVLNYVDVLLVLND